MRAGARQMRSSASCSSPNTVVAPISSTITPITVPITPVLGLLTLLSTSWMPLAASGPIRPSIWPNSSPRTASSPKTSPASEITITSSGPIENTV